MMMDPDGFPQGSPGDVGDLNGSDSGKQWLRDYGIGNGDRRLAFSRQTSLRTAEALTPRNLEINDSVTPLLARNSSGVNIPPEMYFGKSPFVEEITRDQKFDLYVVTLSVLRAIGSGHRLMKRLLWMIFMNVAYSTAELMIGIFSGRVGKLLCLN